MSDEHDPTPDNEPRRIAMQLSVDADMANGVYANVAAVWHTPHDFTLDFALMGMIATGPDGNAMANCPVVARVKVSPSVIFQIAKAIAENVDEYEQVYGAITPINDDGPVFPPEFGS